MKQGLFRWLYLCAQRRPYVIAGLLVISQPGFAQTANLTPKPITKPSIPIHSKVLSTRPLSATHLLNQLSAALTSERPHEAHALATELHQRWPDQDEYTALWFDSQTSGPQQNEQAIHALLRLRQAQPGSAAIAFSLGRQYAQSGRWSDAQSAFQTAHALAPNHPDPAYNLAVCWEQLRQSTLAKHHYQRALALLSASDSPSIPISTLPAARIQAQLDRLGQHTAD